MIGRENICYTLEQDRLACSTGAENRKYRASRNTEIHSRENLLSAKGLVQPRHFKGNILIFDCHVHTKKELMM
jgi:hypothetical protein